MATVDLTDVRPYRDSFAEDSLGSPAELWAAPPLAPIGDEDAFHPPEPSDLSETFGSRRQLIAGTAIVAALGAAVLTYFFLASPGAKAPAETSPIASSPTAVKSSSETQGQPAPTVAEPSPGVVPSPDTAQNPDLVFLQRPGVNIRSAASKRARSRDCPQGHAVHSYRPGGGLGPGREHPREGLGQFPISGA